MWFIVARPLLPRLLLSIARSGYDKIADPQAITTNVTRIISRSSTARKGSKGASRNDAVYKSAIDVKSWMRMRKPKSIVVRVHAIGSRGAFNSDHDVGIPTEADTCRPFSGLSQHSRGRPSYAP